jgi:GNAT superfamily N-acetyltransferase
MESRTKIVPVCEIFALRWAVLRTGLPRETAVYPEDGQEGTFHVAAYDDAGTVAGCVTFFPEPFPRETAFPGEAAAPAYRFRGVAGAPEPRGQGYGAAVLHAGLAEAAARGARLAWCNGRTSARGFYEHQGFTATGEEFEIAPIGPHHVFVTKLG